MHCGVLILVGGRDQRGAQRADDHGQAAA